MDSQIPKDCDFLINDACAVVKYRRICLLNLCSTRLFLYQDWMDRDGQGRRSLLKATGLELEPQLNSCLGKGRSLLSCLVLPL